jgi:CheY-like chemotaxis protein
MNPTILVVEDEQAMRLLLREFLEILGYTVIVAEQGQEAIGICRTTPVDLAFLDMNLPDMNGMELMNRLRGSGAVFPFVVLSANLRESFTGDVTPLGVREILEKPVDLDVIETVVKKILSAAA